MSSIPLDIKNRIIELCQLMIQEQMNILEGCRELTTLFHEINPNFKEEAFLFFVGIASETDHFPLGEFRSHCSQAYLEKADQEMAEFLKKYQRQIVEHCEKVVQKILTM